jgi:hypothetical protein
MKLTKKQIATLNEHPHHPDGKGPSICPQCYKRRVLVIHAGRKRRNRRPRSKCRECFANMYRDIPCTPTNRRRKRSSADGVASLVMSGAVIGVALPMVGQYARRKAKQ